MELYSMPQLDKSSAYPDVQYVERGDVCSTVLPVDVKKFSPVSGDILTSCAWSAVIHQPAEDSEPEDLPSTVDMDAIKGSPATPLPRPLLWSESNRGQGRQQGGKDGADDEDGSDDEDDEDDDEDDSSSEDSSSHSDDNDADSESGNGNDSASDSGSGSSSHSCDSDSDSESSGSSSSSQSCLSDPPSPAPRPKQFLARETNREQQNLASFKAKLSSLKPTVRQISTEKQEEKHARVVGKPKEEERKEDKKPVDIKKEDDIAVKRELSVVEEVKRKEEANRLPLKSRAGSKDDECSKEKGRESNTRVLPLRAARRKENNSDNRKPLLRSKGRGAATSSRNTASRMDDSEQSDGGNEVCSRDEFSQLAEQLKNSPDNLQVINEEDLAAILPDVEAADSASFDPFEDVNSSAAEKKSSGATNAAVSSGTSVATSSTANESGSDVELPDQVVSDAIKRIQVDSEDKPCPTSVTDNNDDDDSSVDGDNPRTVYSSSLLEQFNETTQRLSGNNSLRAASSKRTLAAGKNGMVADESSRRRCRPQKISSSSRAEHGGPVAAKCGPAELEVYCSVSNVSPDSGIYCVAGSPWHQSSPAHSPQHLSKPFPSPPHHSILLSQSSGKKVALKAGGSKSRSVKKAEVSRDRSKSVLVPCIQDSDEEISPLLSAPSRRGPGRPKKAPPILEPCLPLNPKARERPSTTSRGSSKKQGTSGNASDRRAKPQSHAVKPVEVQMTSQGVQCDQFELSHSKEKKRKRNGNSQGSQGKPVCKEEKKKKHGNNGGGVKNICDQGQKPLENLGNNSQLSPSKSQSAWKQPSPNKSDSSHISSSSSKQKLPASVEKKKKGRRRGEAARLAAAAAALMATSALVNNKNSQPVSAPPSIAKPPKFAVSSGLKQSHHKHKRHRRRKPGYRRNRTIQVDPAFLSELEKLILEFQRCCSIGRLPQAAIRCSDGTRLPSIFRVRRIIKKRKGSERSRNSDRDSGPETEAPATQNKASSGGKRRPKKNAVETPKGRDRPEANNEQRLPLKKRHYHVSTSASNLQGSTTSSPEVYNDLSSSPGDEQSEKGSPTNSISSKSSASSTSSGHKGNVACGKPTSSTTTSKISNPTSSVSEKSVSASPSPSECISDATNICATSKENVATSTEPIQVKENAPNAPAKLNVTPLIGSTNKSSVSSTSPANEPSILSKANSAATFASVINSANKSFSFNSSTSGNFYASGGTPFSANTSLSSVIGFGDVNNKPDSTSSSTAESASSSGVAAKGVETPESVSDIAKSDVKTISSKSSSPATVSSTDSKDTSTSEKSLSLPAKVKQTTEVARNSIDEAIEACITKFTCPTSHSLVLPARAVITTPKKRHRMEMQGKSGTVAGKGKETDATSQPAKRSNCRSSSSMSAGLPSTSPGQSKSSVAHPPTISSVERKMPESGIFEPSSSHDDYVVDVPLPATPVKSVISVLSKLKCSTPTSQIEEATSTQNELTLTSHNLRQKKNSSAPLVEASAEKKIPTKVESSQSNKSKNKPEANFTEQIAEDSTCVARPPPHALIKPESAYQSTAERWMISKVKRETNNSPFMGSSEILELPAVSKCEPSSADSSEENHENFSLDENEEENNVLSSEDSPTTDLQPGKHSPSKTEHDVSLANRHRRQPDSAKKKKKSDRSGPSLTDIKSVRIQVKKLSASDLDLTKHNQVVSKQRARRRKCNKTGFPNKRKRKKKQVDTVIDDGQPFPLPSVISTPVTDDVQNNVEPTEEVANQSELRPLSKVQNRKEPQKKADVSDNIIHKKSETSKSETDTKNIQEQYDFDFSKVSESKDLATTLIKEGIDLSAILNVGSRLLRVRDEKLDNDVTPKTSDVKTLSPILNRKTSKSKPKNSRRARTVIKAMRAKFTEDSSPLRPIKAKFADDSIGKNKEQGMIFSSDSEDESQKKLFGSEQNLSNEPKTVHKKDKKRNININGDESAKAKNSKLDKEDDTDSVSSRSKVKMDQDVPSRGKRKSEETSTARPSKRPRGMTKLELESDCDESIVDGQPTVSRASSEDELLKTGGKDAKQPRWRKKYLPAGLFSDYYKQDEPRQTTEWKKGLQYKSEEHPHGLLPPPYHCGKWLRQRKINFQLPYDLWWLHTHNRLPGRDLVPSWNYKKIRTNVYYNVKPTYMHEPQACNCKRPETSNEKACGDDCINRLVYTECTPDLCPLRELCSNQRIQRHEWAPGLDRFMTKEKGWGVRTKLPIKNGEFILEYVGEVVSDREFKERMASRYTRDTHHYCLHLDGGLVIDGHRMGGDGRFVNHSCEPNCEMQKWSVNGLFRMALFALRDIEAHEELAYDYNFSLFNPAEGQPCKCGSTICRGVIGGKSQRISGAPATQNSTTKVSVQDVSERKGSRKNKRKACRRNDGESAAENLRQRKRVEAQRLSQLLTLNIRHMSHQQRSFVQQHSCFLLRNLEKVRRLKERLKQASQRGDGFTKPPPVKQSDVFLTQLNALSTPRSVRTRRLAQAEDNPELTRNAKLACVLKDLYSTLVTAKAENGELLSTPFMTLPNKRKLPLYYERIREPIDFTTVEQNINSGLYSTLEAFDSDVSRILSNNLRFYGRTSDMGLSSVCLRKIYVNAKKDVLPQLTYVLGESVPAAFLAEKNQAEEDVIRCICGLYRDEGMMIQCERCLVWQHCDCVRADSSVEHYLCEVCHPRNVDLEIYMDPQPSYATEDQINYVTLLRSDLQIRQGDTVYVLRDISEEEGSDVKVTYKTIKDPKFADMDIFRVERLWKDKEGKRFAFGHHYLRPHETYHEPTRKFYPNEVMRVPLYEIISLDLIWARCWVLDPTTYCKGRPVEAVEEHVYICEYRVDKSAHLFSRISKAGRPPICTKSYAFESFDTRLKPVRTYTPHGPVPPNIRPKSRSTGHQADDTKSTLLHTGGEEVEDEEVSVSRIKAPDVAQKRVRQRDRLNHILLCLLGNLQCKQPLDLSYLLEPVRRNRKRPTQ